MEREEAFPVEEADEEEVRGVLHSEGYSSVLQGPIRFEYPAVPLAEERPPSPAPPAAEPAPANDEDVSEDEGAVDPEAKKFWLRMVAARPHDWKSIADARDALDSRDWRDREAAMRLAREAGEAPGRAVPAERGKVAGRTYRQVNVKLGEPDYEALKGLAVARDLPPSTMARILVRKGIHEAAGL